MLSQLSEGSESQPMSPRQLRAISTVMSIASHSIPKMYVLGSGVISSLPSPIKTVVEGWTDKKASEFPELGSWVRTYIFLSQFYKASNFYEFFFASLDDISSHTSLIHLLLK